MSLPIPITDLILMLGVAALVYMVARNRPVPMTNGATARLLLDQVAAVTADRDRHKELALRFEARVQELERDAAAYRRAIRMMQDEMDRRQHGG